MTSPWRHYLYDCPYEVEKAEEEDDVETHSAILGGPVGVIAPARGRVFKPEEFEPGADNVIVLSDRFWTRRFSGDPTRAHRPPG